MVGRMKRDIRQYGDFQTPHQLAREVCEVLVRRGISPGSVVEPTCGRGTFLEAAVEHFPSAQRLLGVEVNQAHVREAHARLGTSAEVLQGDFFDTDWQSLLSRAPEPLLVLGNPPWVTNAELGTLQSTNLPVKNNTQGLERLDALTGKSNFDISEWMLTNQLEWLRNRSGWLAVLVKTSVARKLLRQAWQRHYPVGRAAIYRINAMRHFKAAVEAGLLLLPVSVGERSLDCDVFHSLADVHPRSTIGFHDEALVSDVQPYMKNRGLIGTNTRYVWRSGVKHDCAKVMELSAGDSGTLTNGRGEKVDIEPDSVFPLLKSSDVARGRVHNNRYVIVTQRNIGEDTAKLAESVPRTWRYLVDHADTFDARRSAIYRGKPRFSMFGVGAYTFAPWKIAVSGFYTSINFTKVGPVEGKPVVLDDTVYFLPCQSESEADFIQALVRSRPFVELLGALMFDDEKRPVTAELLRRISLERVAQRLHLIDQYRGYAGEVQPNQLQLTLVQANCAAPKISASSI